MDCVAIRSENKVGWGKENVRVMLLDGKGLNDAARLTWEGTIILVPLVVPVGNLSGLP